MRNHDRRAVRQRKNSKRELPDLRLAGLSNFQQACRARLSDDRSKPLDEETPAEPPRSLRVRSVSVCLLLDGIHSDQPFKFLTAKPLA